VKRIAKILLLALTMGVTRTDALACAMCFGKNDSNMAQGMNAGIFALLFVIVAVLGGVAGFFIYLARRAAVSDNSLPVEMPAQMHAEMEKV